MKNLQNTVMSCRCESHFWSCLLPRLCLVVFLSRLELCSALCPWYFFFSSIVKFPRMLLSPTAEWQWFLAGHCPVLAQCCCALGDRSLMWDYIEHRIPAVTFRGQEDFEIQCMWLHSFCQNWIRAPAAYFYLNLMLSRVQRQLLHLLQIIKRKKKKAECTSLIVSEAVCVDGLSVIHKLSRLKGNISEITRADRCIYTHGTFKCANAKMFFFYRSVSDKLPHQFHPLYFCFPANASQNK